MHVLLDTHALVWWLADDPSISKRARATIADTNNTILISAASAWEIATKVRLGKLPGAVELAANFVESIEREGFTMLPISCDHAIRAGSLAGAHKDPFDRMLIAQSQAENLTLISDEPVFDCYGVRRIW